MKKTIAVLLSASLLAGTAVVLTPVNAAETEKNDIPLTAEQKIFLNSVKSAETEFDCDPESIVTFIVEIEGDNLIDLALGNGFENVADFVLSEQGKTAVKQISEQQQTVRNRILSAISDTDFSDSQSYKSAVSGFSLKLKYAYKEALEWIEGVKSVCVAGSYEPCKTQTADTGTVISYPQKQMNLNAAYEQGYTGKGQVIAVIDTSFLVSHEAFSTAPENPKYSAEDIKTIVENADLNINETIPTDTLYISEKIPFGYDYADDDNELYNSPDDDHGTHVAGIAAGNNGKDGSEQFHGAAYDAQLYLMKCQSDDVGGFYDNIGVKAIDDSIILGADCINMSFGHSKGYSEEMDNLYAEYIRKGNECGVFFSCAAGNEGYMGYAENIPVNAENTDYGTVNYSSVIKETMSVANALNNGGIISTLNINDTTVDFVSANNYDFASNAPESAEYIYIGGIGEESDYTDKDVSGKFVVTNRGIIPFANKMQTAYGHGAIGILIINNNPSEMLTPNFGDNVVIPAAALPYSTKAYFEEHPTGTISNVQSYYGEIKKSGIASDSCYGCTPELNLKPEIAAVGTNVYSANVKNENGYIAFSGTSMATPYITGIAAIIKQYIKENKTGYFDTVSTDTLTNLVSNLMMSTANPIPYNDTVYYSPRVEGAGMVNAANALNTKAYLSMSADGTQKAKAELGDNVDGSYSFDFYIVNMSADTLTYTPSVTVQTDGYTLKDGKTYNSTTPVNIDDHITVVWGEENITVNAHESKKVTVNLSVDKDFSEEYKTYFTNGFFVEGFVTLNSPDETGLTLPFMGYDGDWLDAPLFDNTIYDDTPSDTGFKNYIAYCPDREDTKFTVQLGLNDFTGETLTNNFYITSDTLVFPCFYLLRNAKNYKAEIIDTDGNIIYSCEVGDIFSYYGYYSLFVDLFFNDALNNMPKLENGKTYTYIISGTVLGFDALKTKTHTLTYTLTVDDTAPEIVKATTYTEKGKTLIKVIAKDNDKLQCFALYDAVYNEESGKFEDGEEFALSKSNLVSNKTYEDGTTEFVYDISDIKDYLASDNIFISAVDYAWNESDLCLLNLNGKSEEESSEPSKEESSQPIEESSEPSEEESSQPVEESSEPSKEESSQPVEESSEPSKEESSQPVEESSEPSMEQSSQSSNSGSMNTGSSSPITLILIIMVSTAICIVVATKRKKHF